MDSTAYTLLLAMGAAVCAAFISGWLLHMMVPLSTFWIVMLVNLVTAPVGLFVPWYCPRQRQWAVVPTGNIFLSAMLSILVSAGVLVLDRAVLNEVPSDMMMTDQFVRTLIAVCGIAMATSLVIFLMHYSLVQEAAEMRRMGRRVRRLLWNAPKAKLMLCDDLAEVAPGECAICLEELATLEAALAYAPADATKVLPTQGLLQFPCRHVFHGSCADRWMAQEVSCPMCRQQIGSLARCVRICLRHDCERPPGATAEECEGSEGNGTEAAGEDCEGDGKEGQVLGSVVLEVALTAEGEVDPNGHNPNAEQEECSSSRSVRCSRTNSSSCSSSSNTAQATCQATVGSNPLPGLGAAEAASEPGSGAAARGLAVQAAMASVLPTRQPRAHADADKASEASEVQGDQRARGPRQDVRAAL